MRRLLVVAAFCALLIVGCGGETDEAAGPPTTTSATESTPALDAAGRRPAPAIEGVSLDGEPISLADYRGRPVFVNVWSSWWSTCQSEAVAYAEFQEGHPELSYLGINVAETSDEARVFLQEYGWTWPSIQDPQRDRARKLGADYQPHVIVVDAGGRIVTSFEGRGDAATWESLADQLP